MLPLDRGIPSCQQICDRLSLLTGIRIDDQRTVIDLTTAAGKRALDVLNEMQSAGVLHSQPSSWAESCVRLSLHIHPWQLMTYQRGDKLGTQESSLTYDVNELLDRLPVGKRLAKLEELATSPDVYLRLETLKVCHEAIAAGSRSDTHLKIIHHGLFDISRDATNLARRSFFTMIEQGFAIERTRKAALGALRGFQSHVHAVGVALYTELVRLGYYHDAALDDIRDLVAAGSWSQREVAAELAAELCIHAHLRSGLADQMYELCERGTTGDLVGALEIGKRLLQHGYPAQDLITLALKAIASNKGGIRSEGFRFLVKLDENGAHLEQVDIPCMATLKSELSFSGETTSASELLGRLAARQTDLDKSLALINECASLGRPGHYAVIQMATALLARDAAEDKLVELADRLLRSDPSSDHPIIGLKLFTLLVDKRAWALERAEAANAYRADTYGKPCVELMCALVQRSKALQSALDYVEKCIQTANAKDPESADYHFLDIKLLGLLAEQGLGIDLAQQTFINMCRKASTNNLEALLGSLLKSDFAKEAVSELVWGLAHRIADQSYYSERFIQQNIFLLGWLCKKQRSVSHYIDAAVEDVAAHNPEFSSHEWQEIVKLAKAAC